MKSKSMRQFIKENRNELNRLIWAAAFNQHRLNDREREMWILNDEYLYCWARSEGVQL